MFEDIEIKSFKEYITEQELLKELNANDPLDDEDYYANDDDNNDDGINAGAKSAAEIPSNGKSDKPKQKPTVTEPEREPEIDNSNFLGVSKPISLKIDSSLSPIEVRAKLREQYNKIKDTYDNLESLLTAEGFKTSNNPGAPMNMIGDDSLLMLKNEWVTKWNEHIKKYRDTKKNAEDLKTMQSRWTSKSKKEQAWERVNDKDNAGHLPKSVVDARKKAEAAAAEEVKEEGFNEKGELLSEFSINFLERKKAFLDSLRSVPKAFRTSSELSSGVGNRFSSKNIINTAEKSRMNNKEGVYGIGGDNNTKFADNMYRKFLADARAIIFKERPTGLAYLRRAEKNLSKYENRAKYIKVGDNTYSSEISKDLYRAQAILNSIGSRLKSLISNYRASLNKISDEIKLRDVKYTKDIEGTNAQKALENQEARMGRRQEMQHKIADQITNSGEHEVAAQEQDAEADDQKKEEKLKNNLPKDTKPKNDVEKQFNYMKNVAMAKVNKLIPENKRDSEETYNPENIIKEIDKLKNQKTWSPKKFDNETLGNKEVKKATALAMYVIAVNLDEIKKLNGLSKAEFQSSLANKFDKWFDRAYRKFVKTDANQIFDLAKKYVTPKKSFFKKSGDKIKKTTELVKNLPKDIKNRKAAKQTEKYWNSDDYEVANMSAKDFNGEEPQNTPTDILSYALQKAKDNK